MDLNTVKEIVDTMKYGLSSFKTLVMRPNLATKEINRLYYSKFGKHEYNPSGINIFEEDWDNMIILDSCRFDTFERIHDLPGKLESRISRGSMSKEFVKGNFSNRKLHDVVYVTCNAWFAKLYHEINTEVHDFIPIEKKYHPEKSERLNKRAKEIANKYQNKRILIHHMLPHLPFIGSTAKEHFPDPDDQRNNLYSDMFENNSHITDKQLRQAYKENLKIILPFVKELLEQLSGKTVVTADHGEMLGDRASPLPHKDYGHPTKLWCPQLVKVPWLIHKSGKKRNIVPEPPKEDNLKGIESDRVKQALRDMGYVV